MLNIHFLSVLHGRYNRMSAGLILDLNDTETISVAKSWVLSPMIEFLSTTPAQRIDNVLVGGSSF